MDPITMAMMSMAGGGQDQSAFGGGSAGGVNSDALDPILAGLKAQQGQKPVFSGGVSGVGQPFLQQMPNILTGALNGAFQRMGSVPTTPSLGQLIAGGR